MLNLNTAKSNNFPRTLKRPPSLRHKFYSTVARIYCIGFFNRPGQYFLMFLNFTAMVKQIEKLKQDRIKLLQNGVTEPNVKKPELNSTKVSQNVSYEIVALHISPDLGERILLSADRSILEEVFPECSQAAVAARSGAAWNQHEGMQVIRFPLNGFCKLNSIQVLTRLINSGFMLKASTGGGVESQKFSEYLLIRRSG